MNSKNSTVENGIEITNNNASSYQTVIITNNNIHHNASDGVNMLNINGTLTASFDGNTIYSNTSRGVAIEIDNGSSTISVTNNVFQCNGNVGFTVASTPACCVTLLNNTAGNDDTGTDFALSNVSNNSFVVKMEGNEGTIKLLGAPFTMGSCD